MSDAVLFEVPEPGIAVLTINRPDSRNALSRDVREGLFAAWERFENDPELRVAILTAAGDKAFCAGGDLKEMAQLGLEVPPPAMFPVPGDTVAVTKPTIAAVNGVAYAGGWLIAQACDLCVASQTARFAITEVKVGRGSPWAAPLIHMIPQRIFMEIVLTGDPITAQRAYEVGLVNRVTAPENLLDEALVLARRIAGNAPLSVLAGKETVHLATEMLCQRAGIEMTAVPNRGGVEGLLDLQAGRIHCNFQSPVEALPSLQEGKTRALAISSRQRLANLPDVPTVAETLPSFEAVLWMALFAPASTPAPIIRRVADALRAVTDNGEYQDRMAQMGLSAETGDANQVRTLLAEDTVSWRNVITEATCSMVRHHPSAPHSNSGLWLTQCGPAAPATAWLYRIASATSSSLYPAVQEYADRPAGLMATPRGGGGAHG